MHDEVLTSTQWAWFKSEFEFGEVPLLPAFVDRISNDTVTRKQEDERPAFG